MIFKRCVYIHMGNFLYKYGWNRSLDNKFMNLFRYVRVSGERQNRFNETHLHVVQKIVYIKSIFAVVFQTMHCHINL